MRVSPASRSAYRPHGRCHSTAGQCNNILFTRRLSAKVFARTGACAGMCLVPFWVPNKSAINAPPMPIMPMSHGHFTLSLRSLTLTLSLRYAGIATCQHDTGSGHLHGRVGTISRSDGLCCAFSVASHGAPDPAADENYRMGSDRTSTTLTF